MFRLRAVSDDEVAKRRQDRDYVVICRPGAPPRFAVLERQDMLNKWAEVPIVAPEAADRSRADMVDPRLKPMELKAN